MTSIWEKNYLPRTQTQGWKFAARSARSRSWKKHSQCACVTNITILQFSSAYRKTKTQTATATHAHTYTRRELGNAARKGPPALLD